MLKTACKQLNIDVSQVFDPPPTSSPRQTKFYLDSILILQPRLPEL